MEQSSAIMEMKIAIVLRVFKIAKMLSVATLTYGLENRIAMMEIS